MGTLPHHPPVHDERAVLAARVSAVSLSLVNAADAIDAGDYAQAHERVTLAMLTVGGAAATLRRMLGG